LLISNNPRNKKIAKAKKEKRKNRPRKQMDESKGKPKQLAHPQYGRHFCLWICGLGSRTTTEQGKKRISIMLWFCTLNRNMETIFTTN